MYVKLDICSLDQPFIRMIRDGKLLHSFDGRLFAQFTKIIGTWFLTIVTRNGLINEPLKSE